MNCLKYLKYLCFLLLISAFSCKTNQRIGKYKEGKWVTYDTVQYKIRKSVGKYKQGNPIGKWKYYINGKIAKKEMYRKDSCLIKTYFENGKIESTGQTKFIDTENEIKWYYYGEWKFYNENGKLILSKYYVGGNKIKEVTYE